MKNFILLGLTLFLSSCYWRDGCLVLPQSVHCFDKVSEAALYQKPDTIGFTNTEQRWKDIVACGGMRTKDGYFIQQTMDRAFKIKKQELEQQGKTVTEAEAGARIGYYDLAFYIPKCMKEKGYIKMGNCGEKDEKCNL
ncbi:hypothetical protein [Stenoxybacter acetivorans]|uniref:hypothetical protein n=1 Tax=Stenoxybacter acetivorans TaxID=422441 RepID=UPI000690B67D|nr:hypothetical protein [Stenoxybacter acetivorans]